MIKSDTKTFFSRYWIRLIFLIVFILIVIGLRITGISDYFTVTQIQKQQGFLKSIVDNYYFTSVLSYIFSYILVITFSLPVAAVFTIAGGFLFGTFLGALYANIGATLGATLSFLLVRYLIGNLIQRQYASQLTWFNRQTRQHGRIFLLFIHFVAIVPFFLINVLAGLSSIHMWTFIWTTAIGILPGSLVYSYAGNQLTTIDSIRDVFSWNVIVAFLLLAAFALIPLFYNVYKKQGVNKL